jgi:hypothetical protein
LKGSEKHPCRMCGSASYCSRPPETRRKLPQNFYQERLSLESSLGNKGIAVQDVFESGVYASKLDEIETDLVV